MSLAECRFAHIRLPRLSGLFYPRALACATAFFALPAPAMELDPECVFREGEVNSCTHVVACIGGSDVFVGGSWGWESGTLRGRLSTGAACEGVWDNATGQAQFACTDNQEGTVQYVRRDDPTGTAIGFGSTRAGRPIEAWSGDNIAEFVRRETGEVTLACGTYEIPMS